MKMDRLIGILSILLRSEQVTAPQLAEAFEVSRRTISRDIDALCQAGIPIRTAQGAGGGISIMSGYRLDMALLSSADMNAILTGLKSLDSVSGTNYYAKLMEKLSGTPEGPGHMIIDLASWYKEPLSERIGLIEEAISAHRLVGFRYYAPSGESRRQVEPYYIVYQWGSWYLWGWCIERRDWRMFKLRRMTRLALGEGFAPREHPYPDMSDERVFPENYMVEAIVPARWKWRLVECYGEHCFTNEPDGRCRTAIGFTNMTAALEWLVGFCGEAEVLGPREVIEALKKMGEKLLNGPQT